MIQRQPIRLHVECLEDRSTPSVSPIDFNSLFTQFTTALQNFSPPTLPALTLPSLPSLPQLPSFDLPTLSLPQFPAFPQLPTLPSFPQISFSSFPSLPSFPQLPFDFSDELESRLTEVIQSAQNVLAQIDAQAAALFSELADNLLSHIQT